MTVADVNTQLDKRRTQSIEATGGLRDWAKLPVKVRVQILTDGDYAWASDEKLLKLFGPDADPAAAQYLFHHSPRAYRTLRALWIESQR